MEQCDRSPFLSETGRFEKKKQPSRRLTRPGISLVEVLMIIALLSSIIIPFVLFTTRSSQNSKGLSIQSTRGILMKRLMDEMDPARPDFFTQFSSTSMQTTVSESGQTIPYIRVANTTGSDAFTRVVNFYLYNTTSDAVSSPLLKTTQTLDTDEIRIACTQTSSNSPLVDSSGRTWIDDLAYAAGTVQPGYVSAGSTTSSASDILNTSGNDDALFQSQRVGTSAANIDYNIPVNSGSYTVKLYFAELVSTITGSSPNRRRMDIYLEGSAVKTSYSPYEVTGGTYYANIQSFDVTVTDGVLNISIRKSATSDNDARIAGIVVTKRTMI